MMGAFRDERRSHMIAQRAPVPRLRTNPLSVREALRHGHLARKRRQQSLPAWPSTYRSSWREAMPREPADEALDQRRQARRDKPDNYL
jgi:hypothetical protein